MYIFSLVLFFVCLLLSEADRSSENESKLIEEYLNNLKDNYDPRIPPEGNDGPGSPVKIQVSMYIIDITDVDDHNMDFEAQFYFRQMWNDSRLQYEDIDSIIQRNERYIWTPDLFFVEAKDGSLHNIIHPNMFVSILPSGEVKFSVKLSMKFVCKMDLRKYPHDTQTCVINVESYGFQRKDIELAWKDGKDYKPLLASSNISLTEFDLIEAKPSAKYSSFSFGEFSSLEINLTFKRKIGYFTSRLYVPFLILVLISWLSFWIKSEERCLRLSLLFVILYLMITISSEINASAPPVSYTKGSDVWIGFCESLVFAAFLEYIAVYLMLKKESEKDSPSSNRVYSPNLDPEAKDPNMSTDSAKSPLSKLINLIDARRGENGRSNFRSHRIDKISKFLFPSVFIIFNIVYWSVYCCN